jgi:hypothetical protein
MNEWDEELRMLASRVDALEKYAEELKQHLEALEKRSLLRLRGKLYCRICAAGPGATLEPPPSKVEEEFHLAGHGEPVGERPAPYRWSEVEGLAAEKHRK